MATASNGGHGELSYLPDNYLNLNLGSTLWLVNPDSYERRQISEWFTFRNPAFAAAIKAGRSVRGIPAELRFWRELEHGIIEVPRGAARRIWKDLPRKKRLVDFRSTGDPFNFAFHGELRPDQEEMLQGALKSDQGIIEAPTGAGKTVLSLALIAKRGVQTLVVVHTKDLMEQWIDRAERFLGMPRKDIGVIGDGRQEWGPLTIGMIQTLAKGPELFLGAESGFGQVIVDECHHVAAEQYGKFLAYCDQKYLVGVTATPFRRDAVENRVIFWRLGPILAKGDRARLVEAGAISDFELVWRDTGFVPKADPKGDYSTALTELCSDFRRNRLIASDVAAEYRSGEKILVVVARKAQARSISALLAMKDVPALVLTGETKTSDRRQIVEWISDDGIGAIVATGQLVGEGFDLPALTRLFIASPMKHHGTVIQYAGRVLRPAPDGSTPKIYDYRDGGDPPVFQRQADRRDSVYRRMRSEAAGE